MSIKQSVLVQVSGSRQELTVVDIVKCLAMTKKTLSISFYDLIDKSNIKILPSGKRFFHRCLKFNTKAEGKAMKSFISFPVN